MMMLLLLYLKNLEEFWRQRPFVKQPKPSALPVLPFVLISFRKLIKLVRL